MTMRAIVLEYDAKEPIYPVNKVKLNKLGFEVFKVVLAVASQERMMTPFCADKPYRKSKRLNVV